ncbi:hypothetical protein [Nocardioides sp.]|uniref:hypothetical protein n=1 Tax=Nocardioides sp. TaxID=35761 RepID=UPI002ED4410C
MKTMRTGAATAVLIAATLPAFTVGTAHASDGEVERRGSCSGSADWKLKAKPDNGGLEVEGEVDSNRNGQRWRWVLRRNGNVVDRGTGTTRGPSGSFDVERHTGNAQGQDTFRFRAVHKASGQVCRGRIRI